MSTCKRRAQVDKSVDENQDPLSAKEELACEMLQEFVSDKIIGPNNIHTRVLTELADVTSRLLFLIF